MSGEEENIEQRLATLDARLSRYVLFAHTNVLKPLMDDVYYLAGEREDDEYDEDIDVPDFDEEDCINDFRVSEVVVGHFHRRTSYEREKILRSMKCVLDTKSVHLTHLRNATPIDERDKRILMKKKRLVETQGDVGCALYSRLQTAASKEQKE